MPKYRVWIPEDGEKPVLPNVEASSPALAAEEYAERKQTDWTGDSDEVDVSVEESSGQLYEYTVEAEQTVTFTATRILRRSDEAAR